LSLIQFIYLFYANVLKFLAYVLKFDGSDDVIHYVDASVNAHDFSIMYMEQIYVNDDGAIHGLF